MLILIHMLLSSYGILPCFTDDITKGKNYSIDFLIMYELTTNKSNFYNGYFHAKQLKSQSLSGVWAVE